ncbi:MAG: DUF1499 domain-containing protein [Rubrivivax sp.]
MDLILSILKWLVIAIVVLAMVAVLAGQLGVLQGQPKGRLGVHDGKLAPPATTPNSVSSQADLWPNAPRREQARIAPLPMKGNAAQTLVKLKSIIEATPGAVVIESRSDYLYAQFTTRLMKYVDDVEFWVDPSAGVVQVRSASRIGQRDFDANRTRIEAIRAQLAGG